MANRLREEVENAALQAVGSRVGDLVTSVWDHSLGLVVNLILLPKNADDLTQEMQRLQALRDDLSNQAESEREESTLHRNQMEVINQLSVWMDRVASLASEVSRFQRSFEDLSLCIPRIFCLGYNAAELLRRARNLKEEGDALPRSGLVRPLGPVAIEEVPYEISSSSLMGDKATLRRIQGHILDDAVGVVGIWGMGGVGKTTLLKIINNEFLIQGEARGKFELAIWVTVSKDGGISSVREALCNRLGLPADSEKEVLFGKLISKKRFVLLLDDVWESLDFVEIGIPHPSNVNNSCKILFTTRSENVMDADVKVRVGVLDDQGSWELFRSKLGREAAATVDNSDIQPLAKEVVSRCGGLPISLVTVGRALAGARSRSDWQDAINKLDHCAEEVSTGMHQVLTSLKYSYDMLKSDTLRSCLLYCALFPEDHIIAKRTIIENWVGEGFLDPENYDEYDIDQTRNRGHALITQLQDACLLEEGCCDGWFSEEGSYVKLHDTVRDMALWIVRQEFVVLAGRVGTRVPHSHIWQSAKRISFAWNDMITEPPYPSGQLHYPNLTTLLLQVSKLLGKCVPDAFFTHMPALRVLDLCGTPIEEFPIGITSLVQLQHLNLGFTGISHLPVELGKLINLRQLLLTETISLAWIPREAVSPLSRLQVLDMYGSGYVFGRVGAATDEPPSATTTSHIYDNGGGDVVPAAEGAHVLQQLGLSDLEENLKRIGDVSLEVDSSSALGVLAASPVLSGCVRKLSVQFADDDSPPSGAIVSQTIGQLWKLRELQLVDNAENPVEVDLLGCFRPGQLPNLEDLGMNNFKKAQIFIGIHDRPIMSRLRRLSILDCHGFSELTWVGYLPCLEGLHVTGCDGVTELLQQQQLQLLDEIRGGGGGGGGGLLPGDDLEFTTPPLLLNKLKRMVLHYLPSLRSISVQPLLLPSLEILWVLRCPELKGLPLGPESAKNIQEIKGEQAWWDALEWGDDNSFYADQGSSVSVKSKFNDHFIACS